MGLKGVAIATSFICVGLSSFFIYHFIEEVSYTYLLFAYMFLFVLGGVSVFAKLTARAYQVERTEFSRGYELLNQNHYFFMLEAAKVISVLFLTYFYPLEAFLLWVFLDCLDGFSLPYRKRSLTLRHQIDKFTDFLCIVPFYMYAIRVWPDLLIYFTVLFVLNLVKTIGYVSTGNRDLLVYIPNIFVFAYASLVILLRFFPTYLSLIVGNLYNLMIFTAIMLIMSAIYEFTYNGAFIRLRYRIRRSRT
jgi:hypothetical protein